MDKPISTITWNDYTIQTNFHPEMPAGSPPGIEPAYNQWNPKNVRVVGNELQLSIERNSPTIWEGQHVWAAAEGVVINRLPTHGTYCCTFRIVDAGGSPAWTHFSTSNPNPNTSTIFGIFLYDANANVQPNPYGEIDLLELGFQNQPNNGTGWIAKQPGGPVLNNAQFALQPWDAGQPSGTPNFQMVHRINLDVSQVPDTGYVTVLCNWTGGNVPVRYWLAYGAWTSANFPYTAGNTIAYTTPTAVNQYVPRVRPSMRLHLNLWPYGGPSTNSPVYCRISHLEMPK